MSLLSFLFLLIPMGGIVMRTINSRDIDRFVSACTDRELFKIMLLAIGELLVRHDREKLRQKRKAQTEERGVEQ